MLGPLGSLLTEVSSPVGLLGCRILLGRSLEDSSVAHVGDKCTDLISDGTASTASTVSSSVETFISSGFIVLLMVMATMMVSVMMAVVMAMMMAMVTMFVMTVMVVTMVMMLSFMFSLILVLLLSFIILFIFIVTVFNDGCENASWNVFGSHNFDEGMLVLNSFFTNLAEVVILTD